MASKIKQWFLLHRLEFDIVIHSGLTEFDDFIFSDRSICAVGNLLAAGARRSHSFAKSERPARSGLIAPGPRARSGVQPDAQEREEQGA